MPSDTTSRAATGRGAERGTVTIIGAGPGDPGLITVHGWETARRAAAVIHDDLVDRRLLANLGPSERYSLRDTEPGKRLARLREFYAALADRGLSVARLKGGDPMLFARITEELALLRDLAIPYRIVPGVTAATAAAAYAELPLTRRASGRTIAFATGHAPLASGASGLPVADTLCLYMGGGRSRDLCNELLATGWPPDTPLTAVAQVSLPDQRLLHTTVAEVAGGNTTLPTGPVLAVVGVGAEPLASPPWSARVPRILVTGRSVEPYLPYGEVVHTPLVETLPPDDPQPLVDRAVRIAAGAADYDWVAFTSAAAVEALLMAVRQHGGDGRSFAGVGLAAVGPLTASSLRAHGLSADVVAPNESAADLGRVLLDAIGRGADHSPPRVLHPHSDLAADSFAKMLSAAGCEVDAVVAYHTRLPPPERLVRVDLASIDAVAFASPSAVRNFVAVYGSRAPRAAVLVAKGERTAAAVAELLGGIRAVAIEELAGLSANKAAAVTR